MLYEQEGIIHSKKLHTTAVPEAFVGAGHAREAFKTAPNDPAEIDWLRLPTILDSALASRARPAIVIADNGMCSSGRIANYLKAMLGDPRHDALFVCYQARGTPGHVIQRFGPKKGYVDIDGQRYDIRACVASIGG